MSQDTSQKERILAALSPEYFKVDERSLRDLYAAAQALAEALVFYKSSDEEAAGNWSAFFEEAEPYIQKIMAGEWKSDLSRLHQVGQCPPHLGLFLAFLELFGHAQLQLNGLTSSHLYFFYHKILGQEKKGIKPDKVYVFFELARNTERYELARRTPLLAGKDNNGNHLIYTTDRKVFLQQAKVSRFMALNSQKASEGSIYAFPIANSVDGFGTPLAEGQGWYPFGNPATIHSSAEIGWGIGTPMLLLHEGLRNIQVSFSFVNSDAYAAALRALNSTEVEVHLTGPDHWFTKEVAEIRYQDGKLTFLIQLSEVDPPVVPFDKKKHGYRIEAMDWPMLTVVFKQGFAYNRYVLLQSLQFTGVIIRVEVERARSLIVKNDYGELEAGNAFRPFGYSPMKGANFYLGLEETFHKPTENFKVHIKWIGLPESFKTYYEGYLGPTNSLVRNNEEFKVKASVRAQRKWFEIENQADNKGEFPLFSELLVLNIDTVPKRSTTSDWEMRSEDGLLRFTLSSPAPAFGHALYPTVYARAIMSQMQNKEAPIPNEPYTPFIESIELAYAAEEEIDLAKGSTTPFRFFYIEPFGIEEVFNLLEKKVYLKNYPLISGEFYHAGSLFLGIEKLQPPQQLTIFFEIEEEILQDQPNLGFYYLSNTGWRLLSENQVLSDTTLGLKQTGILVLNLPADLTSDNSAMPVGYYWVRISVADHPERFDRILSVRTNAVSCTLHHVPGQVSHEVNRLPPFSIKSFSKKIGEIKQIEQPYSSFGGRPAEKELDYFTRVSEKLRHKMRGISSWDIERLILEQFPEIYKVKCIQHTNANGQLMPGSLHIIVIPGIKQHNQRKILKPLVSNSTLTKISTYITGFLSPHAKIKVTNPNYEEIKIVAQVSFEIQVDAGFYLKQLQNDLQYFLSPWAFHTDIEIQLGSKLYRSSIIEFIESRHYVNFIASIKLLKNGEIIQDHEISPDTRTVIVSADTHDIEAIEPDKIICQTNQGIEQMIIDINFEVQ